MDLFAVGQNVLAQQPFSRLLGTELVEFSARGAVLKIPIRDELKQQFGFVHGGVLAYAADNALTYAGAIGLGVEVVTAEFKINYLKPAQGDFLLARAVLVNAGKTQAVCRCDVYAVHAGGETLCAVAQGTIAKLARAAADQDT
jgi:uncharacterized protein (TIGR00369 family)